MPRILITGATGNIGREVVAELRAADLPVRALSRDPQSAHLPNGVDVVRGDLAVPETLDRALADIETRVPGLGRAIRGFREWATDHAGDFAKV